MYISIFSKNWNCYNNNLTYRSHFRNIQFSLIVALKELILLFFWEKENKKKTIIRGDGDGLKSVWCNTVILEMMWEGELMIQFKQYDWDVRCSHTPSHFLEHHVNVNVNATELLPADRTGLWCASAAANSLPPFSQTHSKSFPFKWW